MKKTLFCVVVALHFAVTGFANIARSGEIESMPMYFDVGNPIEFGGEKYYFAWSARPYSFYMLQEYLPAGQTFENYTGMFTASVMITGNAPLDSRKAVEMKVAELEEVKKKDPVCRYLVSENDGRYILDFIVSKSNDKGELEFVEVDIHYYRDIEINGMKASYLLFYSCRAYGDDIIPFMKSIPSRREKWYEDITSLDIMPEFKFKDKK